MFFKSLILTFVVLFYSLPLRIKPTYHCWCFSSFIPRFTFLTYISNIRTVSLEFWQQQMSCVASLLSFVSVWPQRGSICPAMLLITPEAPSHTSNVMCLIKINKKKCLCIVWPLQGFIDRTVLRGDGMMRKGDGMQRWATGWAWPWDTAARTPALPTELVGSPICGVF